MRSSSDIDAIVPVKASAAAINFLDSSRPTRTDPFSWQDNGSAYVSSLILLLHTFSDVLAPRVACCLHSSVTIKHRAGLAVHRTVHRIRIRILRIRNDQ